MRLLQRFYLDTALSSSPFALRAVEAFADPAHVLFGSDWPHAETELALRFTASLDDQPDMDHAAVDRGNAETLLPRLAALTPAL